MNGAQRGMLEHPTCAMTPQREPPGLIMHVERPQTALAMYMLMAWRINRLMRLVRRHGLMKVGLKPLG